MNELTAETTVTAEHTPAQIVAAMISNGADSRNEEFKTELIDWVEEREPVGFTVAELVAEWMETDDPQTAEGWASEGADLLDAWKY